MTEQDIIPGRYAISEDKRCVVQITGPGKSAEHFAAEFVISEHPSFAVGYQSKCLGLDYFALLPESYSPVNIS